MKGAKYSIVLALLWSIFPCQVLNAVTWISYPASSNNEYGVYHFRKVLELDSLPKVFKVGISADNRYNFFVNGNRVCYGPAKGDLKTYKYDVVDLAPYLKPGRNVFASMVYNGGNDRPLSFVGCQTAFGLFAIEAPSSINTNSSWKSYKNEAYRVISYSELMTPPWFYGFYACGGGDDVSASLYPWSWETESYDDSKWIPAEELKFKNGIPWNLVQRNIPFMDNHIVTPKRIRKADKIRVSNDFLIGRDSILIGSNSKVSILLDFENFTMGYPELVVSKGKNSQIKIKYAESLYEDVNLKSNRDSVSGKKMFGVWDVFRPDGQSNRLFRPLWSRAFRYVELEVETKKDPLHIISLRNEYSGYPYPKVSTFFCDQPEVNRIFEMSLRTFRLCSAETYYDTPYYEQLCYGGDNRPIGSISMYNSTDDRLYKEMMRLYPQSENPTTGLFKAAYPSRFDTDMGTWSLAWIQSLNDYHFMRGDTAFVEQFIPNIERILSYFEKRIDKKLGILGTVESKNFIDWSMHSKSLPFKNSDNNVVQSAMLSLYYTYTLNCAVQLYRNIGKEENARHWQMVSSQINSAVFSTCWDKKQRLFRDYPNRKVYSQHTNILAILSDAIPLEKQDSLLNNILSYKNFNEKTSSYFAYFLFKAFEKTNHENLFLENLQFWHQFISKGYTTCGETGFASQDRSDCHAWSAHPAYFLQSSVCGVKPLDIGFKHILIEPHLGTLNYVTSTIPHPYGEIKVEYRKENNKLIAKIWLPKNLSGVWHYHGQTVDLKEGQNSVENILISE